MKQHISRSFKNQGFTLIELLVVVAIIGILAAILFPVFARARENARRASCMSNLKQIGLGMMMYVQDYDGHFPGAMVGIPGAPSGSGRVVCPTDNGKPCGLFVTTTSGYTKHFKSWMDVIYPYVKSTQLFVCPSAGDPESVPSYGYNRGINRWGLGSSPVTQSQIEQGAELVMLMDCHYSYAPFALNTGTTTGSWYGRSGDKRFVPHFQGANFAFADGHVKWINKTHPLAAAVVWSSNSYWDPL